MSKIDLTKPLELSDGTPVTMNYKGPSGVFTVIVPDSHPFSKDCAGFPAGARSFKSDGTRADYLERPEIFVRNVPEAPKVDWTKPLELSDGTPVELAFPERKLSSDGYLVVIKDHEISGRRYFLPDGTKNPDYYPKTDLVIRNRQEAPASTLDLSKPVQTRGGRPAIFVSKLEDGRLLFNVGPSVPATLVITQSDGRMVRTPGALDQGDIINIKPKPVSTYHNLYEDGTTGKSAHTSFAAARDYAKVGKVRIGIIEITKQDGAVISSTLSRCAPRKRTSSFQQTPFHPL